VRNEHHCSWLFCNHPVFPRETGREECPASSSASGTRDVLIIRHRRIMPDRGVGYHPLSLRHLRTAATIRRGMYIGKQILTTLMTLLLGVGVLFAQLCDLSCASQLGQGRVSANVPAHSPKAGHCHQSKPEPKAKSQSAPLPQKRDHSSDCQSHSYATATKPPAVNSVAAAQQLMPVHAVLPFASAHLPFDQRAGQITQDQSFRSPPGHGAFSVLRI
jgi:hypothetical protein